MPAIGIGIKISGLNHLGYLLDEPQKEPAIIVCASRGDLDSLRLLVLNDGVEAQAFFDFVLRDAVAKTVNAELNILVDIALIGCFAVGLVVGDDSVLIDEVPNADQVIRKIFSKADREFFFNEHRADGGSDQFMMNGGDRDPFVFEFSRLLICFKGDIVRFEGLVKFVGIDLLHIVEWKIDSCFYFLPVIHLDGAMPRLALHHRP